MKAPSLAFAGGAFSFVLPKFRTHPRGECYASKSLRLSGCRDRGFTQSYKHGGSSQKRPATHTDFNVSETAGIIAPNCNIKTAKHRANLVLSKNL
jgi:hypothetical protein